MLLSKLNQHTKPYVRDVQTQKALNEAKRALISYAVNYPELNNRPDRGPGYLPCPDQGPNQTPNPMPGQYDDSLIDGIKQENCSANTGSTLGLLPFADLGLSDLRDSSGERLWYAVSQNFKHHQNVTHVINSETPGLITVDDLDDIVAVVIAPGPPIGSQNRRGDSDYQALIDREFYRVASNYLEDANAITGGGVQEYVTASSDDSDFNDRLVFITRQEIMSAIELRVVNEVRRVLANYYDQNEAYPWLAPFTDNDPVGDPKAGGRLLWGTAGNDSGASTLNDSTADFIQAGVQSGDIVWNLTNGAWVVVGSVANSNQINLNELTFGGNYSFDVGDEYYIDTRNSADSLRGTASVGTAGLILNDANKNFEQLGILPGDVIDIIDGSSDPAASGMIASVSGDQLVISSLSEIGELSEGMQYRIRSNLGIATSSDGAEYELHDDQNDFVTLGVRVGDVVRNLTANTSGIVTDVVSEETLEVTNNFSGGDNYLLTRFNGLSPTTRGLLPFHEPGEALDTGFNVDWSITEINSNQVNLISSGTDSTYNQGLENSVQISDMHSGMVAVDAAEAICVWISISIVDCSGTFIDQEFLRGQVEDSSAGQFSDESRDFSSLGIKRGDKLENLDSSTDGIVYQAIGTTLQYVGVAPGLLPVFNSGDSYRVHVATSMSEQLIAEPPSEPGMVYFDDSDESRLVYEATQVYDVIRHIDGNEGVGLITAKRTACNGEIREWPCDSGEVAQYVFVYDGLQNDIGEYYIDDGDIFIVHSDYVDHRAYSFNMRFGGQPVIMSNGNERNRTVCAGYTDGCVVAQPGELAGDNATQIVTIIDRDADEAILGEANVTIPPTGNPLSSIRVSGLSHQLSVSDDEFPSWFLRNRWHQYIYVAYSNAAGGPDTCTQGDDCLTFDIYGSNNDLLTTYDDIQAIVISMGAQLDGQNRGLAMLNNYLESMVPEVDDLVERKILSPEFNDQFRVVCPDTYYPNPTDPLCPP